MATKMHRLQVSLPHGQVRFLEERARLQGISMAEFVRRLIDRAASSERSTDSLWEIAGMAEDHAPLIDGIAVSECPDLYLTGATGKRTRRR